MTYKRNICLFFGIIFLFALAPKGSAQDSTDIIPAPTEEKILKKPFAENKISDAGILYIKSDSIGYDRFIWNGKRNLGEILNDAPGFFVNTFATAGRSAVSFNGFTKTGIFRDGIQLNDRLFGGFDAEAVNINEIEKIEIISPSMSFLYGTDVFGSAINIITKDKFQPDIFSQLRHSQDRDGALYADFFTNFPLSRKINFIIDLSNHGSDGHYANSDFSIWRGKFRLNYFLSDRLNFRMTFYPQRFQRGLNEGLVNSTSDTLIDERLAEAVNQDSYEKQFNYYSDLQVTARLLKDSSSLTKITFSTQNLLREYRDEENRLNANGIFQSNNFHSVTYSAGIRQNIRFRLIKNFNTALQFGGNADFNAFNFDAVPLSGNNSNIVRYASYNAYSLFSRADVEIYDFSVSGGLKSETIDDINWVSSGLEGKYSLKAADNLNIVFNAGGFQSVYGIYYPALYLESSAAGIYSKSAVKYFELGFSVQYGGFYISIKQFDDNLSDLMKLRNGNYIITHYSENIEASLSLNVLNRQKYGMNRPELFIKSDIAYHDYFFKNKLNIKFGINLKYMSEFSPSLYSQFRNMLSDNPSDIGKSNFNLDFYIGARIGKANVNLTFANLFNNLFYDTYIYPWDNRGGLLNSLSRFTITWDFWN